MRQQKLRTIRELNQRINQYAFLLRESRSSARRSAHTVALDLMSSIAGRRGSDQCYYGRDRRRASVRPP
jgi:hypothetical protein